MNLSFSRSIRSGLVFAGVLAFGAAASAAPPPGMRWGDHSGLAPSTGRARPAPAYPRMSAPPVMRAPAPTTGATTYYHYVPRAYAPGVTWYSYPSRPIVIYSPGTPSVTGPTTAVPYVPSPPALVLPPR